MALPHHRERDVLILALEQPPVNALNLSLRIALFETFQNLRSDTSVRAVVLHGSGKGFCAGGDRTEFGTPQASSRPTLSLDVLRAIETCGKPVVAALHGFAVGGGLELALACDARVAVAGTQIGTPEVKIGLFPLSATQRLPRVVGVGNAVRLMLDGSVLPAECAQTAALFDRIVTTAHELMPVAMEVARYAMLERPVPVRARALPDSDAASELQHVLQDYPLAERTPAQRALIAAVTAAIEAPDFQTGLDQAQQLFDTLGGHRHTLPPSS